MTMPPSGQFQLVVFDVAGTTVLDGDAVVDCLKAALDSHVRVSVQDVRDVMGLPKPLAIRQLLASSGSVPGDALDRTVEGAHQDFRAALIARYREGPALAPAPGALRVFATLRKAGIRVALDTGFSRDILDAVLSRLGWADGTTVDFSIASDEVERGRPYPDLIHRAMALADVVDAGRVAKVGDTPVDVQEGLAAGCGLVVGVTYGTHTRGQLERAGVQVIDSLPDLLPLIGANAA